MATVLYLPDMVYFEVAELNFFLKPSSHFHHPSVFQVAIKLTSSFIFTEGKRFI